MQQPVKQLILALILQKKTLATKSFGEFCHEPAFRSRKSAYLLSRKI
jgi:hypothetical protein